MMVHMAALNKVFFFICTHKPPAVPTLKTKKSRFSFLCPETSYNPQTYSCVRFSIKN